MLSYPVSYNVVFTELPDYIVFYLIIILLGLARGWLITSIAIQIIYEYLCNSGLGLSRLRRVPCNKA